MDNYETKYLKFQKYGETAKTEMWQIMSKHDYLLADVKWYGAWRQYVMYPEPDTLFNTGCLDDIKCFLDKLNANHKAKKQSKTDFEWECIVQGEHAECKACDGKNKKCPHYLPPQLPAMCQECE